MKLWLKISLANIAVLIAVVVVCSTLLLLESKNNMLDNVTHQILSEQRNLSVAFYTMADYELKDVTNPLTRRSGMEYCFSRFADDSSFLIAIEAENNDILYSRMNLRPDLLLPANELPNTSSGYYEWGSTLSTLSNQGTLLTKIDGRHYLIAGSRVSLYDTYLVYTVRDITELFDTINAMILRFIIICTLGVIAGTTLILLLVRRGWGTLQVETHISQLTQTNKRQQLFIAGLTHEFKTPMTSMLIHSDTLLSANLPPESALESLTHIHEQCRWLESLTQKLLNLVMSDNDNVLSLKPENVSDLLNDVCESVSGNLNGIIIKVDCDDSLTLEMDYDLMKSLLINLVNNAIHASESGQQVTISARGNTLQVSDNGKGIPQDELEKVLEPFYMVERSRNKKYGGFGLGLALVKQIADAHNAILTIESEVDVGTNILIKLIKL